MNFIAPCRADKYACKHLEESARSYVRENFESVVLWDNEQPEHAGICSLSQTSLLQILSDDELVGLFLSCTAYSVNVRCQSKTAFCALKQALQQSAKHVRGYQLCIEVPWVAVFAL